MNNALDFTLADVPELDTDPATAHQITHARQPNARKTKTGVEVRTQTGPNMLHAALWYAKRGWHVFPLHTPIFNADGVCVGCTCEAWKRTQARYGPDYTCPQPGKCPAVRWAEKSTTDPDQLHKWFGHQWKVTIAGAVIHYTPNIGIDCGKSGLLVLDEDAYKNTYGDLGDWLSPDEQETPKQLSGSHKGSHIVYAMPAGKDYGNATGDLPVGIDIRGVGGYIVAAPSLHKSGHRYEWLDGYKPHEIELQTVPQAMQAILDEAQEKRIKAQTITFTTPTTERIELIRWKISKEVSELINAPGVPGQRSENDMKVCVSLCYAGATDNDILAVYEHNPIGTQGKFAEAGQRYLALTIGKARAYVELHPRPDIGATVDNLLLYIRTHSFEAMIRSELLASDGTYRTDDSDTKTADAILCEMKAKRRLTINIGKRRLGKLAGIGCNTACRALARLNGWLFDVTLDPLHGAKVSLCDVSRLHQMDPLLSSSIVYKRDPSSANDEINEYSPRKADEPFLIGTSAKMKEQIQDIAQTLEITPKQAKNEYTFASLGESGLRVIDALMRAGDMTAKELAEETGKKMSSIRTAVHKLVQHGIVDASRPSVLLPYTYSLCADVWQRIDEIAPNLRTNTTSAQRENRRLKDAQLWCDRGIEQAKQAQDSEQQQRLERRKAKLATQRIPHLARLLADKQLSQAEIKVIAYTPSRPAGPHPAIQAKLERFHGQARMDLAESRHKEQWETNRLLAENIAAFKATNTPKREWYPKLTLAGFTPNEAKRAIALGGVA